MARDDDLFKYPRTPHLEGSRLQPGDSAADQAPYRAVAGRQVVIEEKMDGAGVGVSFSSAGRLRLQCRGHYLVGGARERQFNPFKPWAAAHEAWLADRLGDRYVMFGEWMFAKHSMFYDALPHLFLEFDVFDRRERVFLSTPRRRRMLEGGPVVTVPVLHQGPAPARAVDLARWMGPSLGRSQRWREQLDLEARRRGLDPSRVASQTDAADHAEGLYVKVEDDDTVLARYKFVRASFTQTLLDSDEHWQKRPLVANGLRAGVDLYAPIANGHWPAVAPPAPRSLRR